MREREREKLKFGSLSSVECVEYRNEGRQRQ